MTADDLRAFCHGYIDCLNRRDWDALGGFVADDVRYGDETVGLAGYRRIAQVDSVIDRVAVADQAR